MRNYNPRFAEPRTENPELAAFANSRNGDTEPRITQLSKARETARKRLADNPSEALDICWDAEVGSYRILRRGFKGNKNVVETVR